MKMERHGQKLNREISGAINVAAHRLALDSEPAIKERLAGAVRVALAEGRDWRAALADAARAAP
jgi:hypothetical protein